MDEDFIVTLPAYLEMGDEAVASLEALVAEASTAGFQGVIEEHSSTGGRGVTWYEILEVYLAAKIGDAAVAHLVDGTLDGVVKVFKDWARKHRRNSHGRPQLIRIRIEEHSEQIEVEVDPEGKTTVYITHPSPEELLGRRREATWTEEDEEDEDADSES